MAMEIPPSPPSPLAGAMAAALPDLRAPPAIPPVVVEAYVEALCSDSAALVTGRLLPAYEALGDGAVDLRVSPCGRAWIDAKTGALTCQHGAAECAANSWMQCAVEAYAPGEYAGFVGCLFESLPMGHRDAPLGDAYFETCAGTSGLDFEVLKSCHEDPERAAALQAACAATTPELDFVPQVLLDGVEVDHNGKELEEEICGAYAAKGGTRPNCPGGAGSTK